MKKVFFPTKLTKDNKALRDYIIREISNYVDLSKSRLLDIGCGNGRFGKLLHDSVKNYFGIDPDKGYIKRAREEVGKIKNIEYVLGKGEKIPFKNKFDVILYSFSWHFIKDYNKSLKELERISDKNSLVIVIEPCLSPKGYKDKRLNEDSPDFDRDLWQKKKKSIERARKYLENQNKFKIIKHDNKRINLWLLKKND